MPGALLAALLTMAADPAAVEDALRHAKNEYAYGSYERAIKELHDLLYPMKLTTDDQVIEARKYLALSYYLLDRLDDVGEEFAKLLHIEPDYQLDPYTVAPPVIDMFESVRKQLKPELDVIRRLRGDRKLEEPIQPGLRLEIERRFTERSDFATFMPFGIGQFHNGDVGAGVVLALSQAVLLAANVGSYLWAVSLRTPRGTYLPQDRDMVRTLAITQYATLAGLGVAWSIGVLHARLRFVPVSEAPKVVREVPLSLVPAPGPPPARGLSLSLEF